MPKKTSKLFNKLSDYKDTQLSKFGIYAYITDDGEVLYIGKDSNIDKGSRHIHHIAISKVKEQSINAYLNTNGVEKRVKYAVLAITMDKEEMDNLEVMYILFYKALGQCRMNTGIDMNPEQIENIGKKILDLANHIKVI